MKTKTFPVIDPVATGENILRLRRARGMTVRDLQRYFGFEDPQAIYKWQKGKTLPSVDHLYALSALLEVPMEDILVAAHQQVNIFLLEQQAAPRCSCYFLPIRRRAENRARSAGRHHHNRYIYACH